MASNEDFVPGLQEQPQELPPGIERRGARRVSGARSSRPPSREQREQGSLRIRLSDNELRAAQLVQERFQLRSTVAALGFCLRTMAQMVEQGQLSGENLAAQLPQHTGRGEEQQSKKQAPAPPPDPLARPAKQESRPLTEDQPPNPAPEADADASTMDSTRLEEA